MSEESRKEIAFINDVIIPNSSEITPPDPEEGTEIYALANELIEKVLYGELTAKEASAREFDTSKLKRILQSLETGLFFCQIFVFII